MVSRWLRSLVMCSVFSSPTISGKPLAAFERLMDAPEVENCMAERECAHEVGPREFEKRDAAPDLALGVAAGELD